MGLKASWPIAAAAVALMIAAAPPGAAQEAGAGIAGVEGTSWNPDTGIYEMVFPIDDNHSYRDTWGACRDGCSRTHEGTDIFASKMTLVFAVAPGTIGWMNDTQGWGFAPGITSGVHVEAGE